MTRKSVVKVILVVLVLLLIFLPFYVFRNYIVLAYKFYKPDYSMVKTNSGVIPILILGKGGEGHSAPDLTDTIMNVYINNNQKRVSLLPLPRDIWITDLRAKLNSGYYWGKQKTGSGLALASESVYGITAIKPEYVVVVDFSIFKDLINSMGGIEVQVQNTFTDNKFPIAGRENDLCQGDKNFACRYESITFNQGLQQMDGETALKFVRSRNAQGDEGTDLAREARQQRVIEAIKNKLLSKEIILYPNKMKNIYAAVSSHIETNIEKDTAMVIARMFFDSRDNINNLAIPEGILVVSNKNPKYDNQYVFIPKNGDWKELQEWITQKI